MWTLDFLTEQLQMKTFVCLLRLLEILTPFLKTTTAKYQVEC